MQNKNSILKKIYGSGVVTFLALQYSLMAEILKTGQADSTVLTTKVSSRQKISNTSTMNWKTKQRHTAFFQ
jgi:hypothetical protein